MTKPPTTPTSHVERYGVTPERIRGIAGALVSLAQLPGDADVDELGRPLDVLLGFIREETDTLLAAYAARTPYGEIGRLTQLARLRDHQEHLIALHVDRCRRSGRSWAEIGDALGVTRQGARQRYGTSSATPAPSGDPLPGLEDVPATTPVSDAPATSRKRHRVTLEEASNGAAWFAQCHTPGCPEVGRGFSSPDRETAAAWRHAHRWQLDDTSSTTS